MVSESLPQRVTPSPDVLFRQVEGEAVMLDLQQKHYYGLDPVGTRIWQLLEQDPNVETLISRMLAEYDVEEAQLRGDLAALFAELASAQLVTIEPARSG